MSATRPYVWNPWSTARRDPGRLAVADDTGAFTFGELTGRADALAAGLAAAGVPDGAVLSTDIPPGPRFFALALAALRHGHGLLPMHRQLFDGPVGPAVAAATATVHVSDRYVAGVASQVRDEELVAAGRRGTVAAVPGRAAGWLMFVSSGTTGEPRAVPRPRPALPYRGVAVTARYAAGADRGPCLMSRPVHHLGTVGPALYALQAGSAVAVQGGEWSPGRFVELVDRYGADTAVLGPDGLLDVIDHGRAPGRPLRVVFHSGAACPPAVKRAGIALLGPVLHEFYGTSRGTLTEIGSAEWLRRPGSVGRPLPGIGIDIVRDGRVLPAGQLGEIRVRLRAVDRDGDEDPSTGTGDIGYLDPDGYLSVVGRADAAGGWDGARLEHEIRLLAGIRDVAVLAEHRLCLVEIGRDGRRDPTPDVLAAAARLDVPIERVRVEPHGTFPRTASGKLARVLLAGHAPAR